VYTFQSILCYSVLHFICFDWIRHGFIRLVLTTKISFYFFPYNQLPTSLFLLFLSIISIGFSFHCRFLCFRLFSLFFTFVHFTRFLSSSSVFVVVLSSIVIIFTVNLYLEGLICGKFAEKYFAYFHYYVYFLCISPILKVFHVLSKYFVYYCRQNLISSPYFFYLL
jgi:hypothetical protein